MLSIKNISKEYSDIKILNDISFSIKNRDRIGLIGGNGVGKSTLLKLIAGEIKPESGVVDTGNEITGYLPQNPYFGDTKIYDYVLSTAGENNIEPYQIEIVFEQLGLDVLDTEISCNLLSGGQKTKLYLATLLLKNPSPTILVLDEPTNNLDLEGLIWLENYIRNFKGSVILTSHDRYFLDSTCSKIIELKETKIKSFGGNYSFYKDQIKIQEEAYERNYLAQQKQIKKTQENIKTSKEEAKIYENIFSSGQPYEKKKAAKSVRGSIIKQRQLERKLESKEYLEKPQSLKKFYVDLAGENPQGKEILNVSNLNFSFGEKELFSNLSLNIFGSEKVLVEGKNGSGKSTLLKIIIGELSPTRGETKFGTNVKFGYFSQDASSLNNNSTGIEELNKVCHDLTKCYMMGIHLHLSQADLHKKVSQLSSGQKIKLEFAKLLSSENNLLILDEPTNHLEIPVREQIEEALLGYQGAILVVSHDRYFVEKLGVTKVVSL